ncbi:MAG: hypothetical protein AAF611_01375 [Bacteroidota bacterium]
MNKKLLYIVLGILFLGGTSFVVYNTISKNKAATAKQKLYEEAHNKIQKAWKGKSLQFPFELYNTMTNEKVDLIAQFQNSTKKYSLVSYLDGECSTCVSELKKWEAFINTHPEFKEKLNIEFLVKSGDIELLKYQVYDQAKSSFIFLWDKENKFKPKNNISDLKAYQTFLIKDNKIVFVGSPIRGEFYIEKLKEIID